MCGLISMTSQALSLRKAVCEDDENINVSVPADTRTSPMNGREHVARRNTLVRKQAFSAGGNKHSQDHSRVFVSLLCHLSGIIPDHALISEDLFSLLRSPYYRALVGNSVTISAASTQQDSHSFFC